MQAARRIGKVTPLLLSTFSRVATCEPHARFDGADADAPRSNAKLPASGFRRFNDRDFDRDDRFRRFRRFNDGDFDRDDRFRRFNHFNRFNEIFVFNDFGFPFFPFYYPYPYYPYGYGRYGYQGGYGNKSSVVQLQQRLARAGYYHGAIDGIMGPATRRAIRAYERDHNMRAHGVIDGQRLTTVSLV
jgi:hypothetical protein